MEALDVWLSLLLLAASICRPRQRAGALHSLWSRFRTQVSIVVEKSPSHQ
jgi:hypothetical protein